MIYVIASLELHAGKRDAYLKEFRKVQPSVRKEKGCIAYEVTVDKRTDIAIQVPYRANAVTIMEQWESLEALHAHLSTTPLVAGRKLQVLEPA
jgi:quinol monooxygenase YgiN